MIPMKGQTNQASHEDGEESGPEDQELDQRPNRGDELRTDTE